MGQQTIAALAVLRRHRSRRFNSGPRLHPTRCFVDVADSQLTSPLSFSLQFRVLRWAASMANCSPPFAPSASVSQLVPKSAGVVSSPYLTPGGQESYSARAGSPAPFHQSRFRFRPHESPCSSSGGLPPDKQPLTPLFLAGVRGFRLLSSHLGIHWD
jgi:hypothetical protein